MKKQLIIIGGGFAGFWSAISAIRQSREIQKRNEVEITLVNPDNQVTIRPRLNELSLEGLRFDLDKYLKPLGILQIIGRVEIIDPEKNELVISTAQGNRNLHYDYLILAAGGSLKLSNLPGIQHTFDVESLDHVQQLEDHIIELAKKDFYEEGASTFVVYGSEYTGLDFVTSIEQKAGTIHAYYSGKKSGFKIILLENGNQVAPSISNDCRQYVDDVIASKNIEFIPNVEPTSIEPAVIHLNNNSRIATRTVIWTKDMVASPLTQFFNGTKDDLGRLTVDQFLKLPEYNNVMAAGKLAHMTGGFRYSTLMDCQYAQFEGRWAGHNAINDLFNFSLKEYVRPGYTNCVDLGEPQTFYATTWERGMQKKRYEERAAENYANSVTMYPWQNVEETVRESFPHIPKFSVTG